MQCDKCARRHTSSIKAKIIDGKPTIIADVECENLSSMGEVLDFKCKGFIRKEEEVNQ